MAQCAGPSSARKEITGLNRMTQKGLRDLCKRDKLYQTPRLNDVLYLHYQGFQYIECLEEYTELKCLWLECNAISEIQGLDQQSKLKCLFLQNNLIQHIDNLGCCPQLDTLNLSSNHIRKLDNIGSDVLPVLNTLNVSSNYLKDSDSLSHLVNCKTLSVLDLANNRIDDILVVKIFEQMPNLRVLVLQGNPVVSRLPQYRKTLILACKELTYLDSRPVFPRDRACAEAWKVGGYEGERKENHRWNRAERKKIRDSVNSTIRLRNRHRPPDQQDSLLTSTDSEAEQEADERAHAGHTRAALENGSVDDIWAEVEGERTKQSSASEDNSDHSASSDEGSNCTSDSLADQIAEQSSNRNLIPKSVKSKLQKNDSNESPIHTETNENEAEETEELGSNEAKTCTQFEIVAIEETKQEKSSKESNEIEENLQEQGVKELPSQPTSEVEEPISSYESDVAGELKEIKELYAGLADDLAEEETISDITTDFKLDDKMCCAETPRPCNFDLKQSPLPKTAEQLAYEIECAEANDKVEQDLRDLTRQMDEDMEWVRLSIENEIPSLEEELTDDTASAEEEVVQSSSAPRSLRLEQEFAERRQRELKPAAAKTDSVTTNVISEPVVEKTDADDDEQAIAFAKVLIDASDDVPKRVFGAGCDKPAHDWPAEERMLQLKVCDVQEIPEQAVNELPTLIVTDVEGKDSEPIIEPLIKESSEQAAANICARKCEAMAEEEASLRKLLQELEDENEMLYKVNTAYEEAINELKSQATEPNPEEVCVALLDELINELQYNEITTAEKPTNFDFGPIESDEEYSYSADPKVEKIVPPELEDPAKGKSIRECLDVFGDFLTALSDPKQTSKLGKRGTTWSEKCRAAQQLLKSPNLPELNKDTPESLDADIAKELEKRKKFVSKSAGRCFAQREKYEDTLEVVDNRLMVVKKDTGALEELPPPPPLISDSEESNDDYDTANEEQEEQATKFEDDGQHTSRLISTRGLWTKPYVPKPRKSAEYLIEEALRRNELRQQSRLKWMDDKTGCIQTDDKDLEFYNQYNNNQDDDDDQEDEDQDDNGQDDDGEEHFYSLETEKAVGCLDAEFLKKLDLNFQEMCGDDAEVAAECMRSYNELKACLKAGSSALQLTNEENEMLQEMREMPWEAESHSDVEQENDLLKKMMQRTKDEELAEHIKLCTGTERLYEQQSRRGLSDEEEGDTVLKKGADEIPLTFQSEPPAAEVIKEPSENPEPSLEQEVQQDAKKEEVQEASSKVASIDDDIISDDSTDYESEEEVPVVEPPMLPEGALQTLICNNIDDGLEPLRPREQASLREIYNLQYVEKKEERKNSTTALREALEAIGEPNPLNADPETHEKMQRNISKLRKSKESDPFMELQTDAKAKWAKIANKLNKFISSDEMNLLENGESDSEEEDYEELKKDLANLKQVDESQIEVQLITRENILDNEAKQVDVSEIDAELSSTQKIPDDGSSSLRNEVAKVDGSEHDLNSGQKISDGGLEQTACKSLHNNEAEQIFKSDDKLEKNEDYLETEKVFFKKKAVENSEHSIEPLVKGEEVEKFVGATRIRTLSQGSGPARPDIELTEQEHDNLAMKPPETASEEKNESEMVSNSNTPQIFDCTSKITTEDKQLSNGADGDKSCGVLKTEEIGCDLEILNDDGDAVMQKLDVTAQVTYEL
ncbi:dynein assembly factor 1, axonemal homolog [Scaptodrosophila lebanonensis]|uniref:Dynein axonemal assembly factor 1 homolog n=1 Tax=Drosophila lebanonensis TaxID=7225 RepID=A0A6J2TL95_DROLE|nr:dynein assembly factor 1, axonemal homolog [Scaptodrosophila lebanonensis]